LGNLQGSLLIAYNTYGYKKARDTQKTLRFSAEM